MPSNRAGFYDHNATASSPDTYHRSLERSYRGDPDAVEIVANGPVVMEESQKQVLQI